MSTTTVVNVRCEAFDVYIGRRSVLMVGAKGTGPGEARQLSASPFGNPFRIGRDGTREQVIEKYRDWIMDRPHLLSQLEELRGKRLGCWCKPAACHGDVLVELIEALA